MTSEHVRSTIAEMVDVISVRAVALNAAAAIVERVLPYVPPESDVTAQTIRIAQSFEHYLLIGEAPE